MATINADEIDWQSGCPEPHKRYLVNRGGRLFVAIPCYGLHAPWWVATTATGEAEPEDMNLDNDKWVEIRA